ncbi:hypothetical protein PWT90_02018 [Aphanocladium album]|nr:hypothetical protein PWT90_02018 [Aphanocladium album]
MGKKDKQKGLWEIEEYHINQHYVQGVAADGRVYYSKVTSQAELPESFWLEDWEYALEQRALSERQAVSSGNSAREARRVDTGRLISQEIANNATIGEVISSGSAAQDKRGKGKKDAGKVTSAHKKKK